MVSTKFAGFVILSFVLKVFTSVKKKIFLFVYPCIDIYFLMLYSLSVGYQRID